MMKKICYLLLIVAVFLLTNRLPVLALDPPQRLEVEQKPWNDRTDCYAPSGTTNTPSTQPSGGGGVTSGKLYFLGDSIGDGSKTELEAAYKAKGFSDVKIDTLPSRNLSGTPPAPDGLAALAADKAQWQDTSAVVIELGTNTSGFKAENIKLALKTLRDDPNFKGKVYWVTGYRTDSNLDGQNETLNSLAGSEGFTVIDWAGVAKAHPDYLADNAHPKAPAGTKAFVDTVVNGVTSSGTNQTVPATSGFGCQCAIGGGGSGPANLQGSDNAQKAYNYFNGREGINAAQAAGIVGNFMIESGDKLDPHADNGSHMGIAQWDYKSATAEDPSTRWGRLIIFAKKNNMDPYELATQVAYVMEELHTTHQQAFTDLKLQTTPQTASDSWLKFYEGAVGQGDAARQGKAAYLFNTYGGGSASSTPTSPTSSPASTSSCPGANQSNNGSGNASQIVSTAQAELALWQGGFNDISKYNGHPDAWCADFLSWVLKQAGTPFTGGGDGGWHIPTVQGVQTYFESIHTWHPKGQDYVPKPGDVVVYNEGLSPYPQHVNIVVSVSGTGFTTIGGNEGNRVSQNSHASFDAAYITGYGTPK